MKNQKLFTVETRKVYCMVQREDSVNIVTDTLENLIKYFGYTLEIGNSWNNKIKRYPKTIKSFINSLQASYEEKEASCYDRTMVTLLKTIK